MIQSMLHADSLEGELRLFAIRNNVTPEYVCKISNERSIVALRKKFVREQIQMGKDWTNKEYSKVLNISISGVHYYREKANEN